jgi:hypothetical protein
MPLLFIRTADSFEAECYNRAGVFAELTCAIGLTMRDSVSQTLPLLPLLRAYTERGILNGTELTQLPVLGSRFRAVLTAPREFLSETCLDNAGDAEFRPMLVRFYEACVGPPLHRETLQRRAGIVRHALDHLLHCRDPLSRKAERCLRPSGPYHVAGLGPVFWSALFQALDPVENPSWTPAIETGLRRLGLAHWRSSHTPGQIYTALLDAYSRLLDLAPNLSALHLDHFLTLVAAMQGRDLWSGAQRLTLSATSVDLAAILRQQRAQFPLRQRLKECGQALHAARAQLESALKVQDGAKIGAALAVADPVSARRCGVPWQKCAEALTLWVGRLWETEDPYDILEAFWRADPIPGAGLWLAPAGLHLRDPRHFQPWNEAVRQGYAALADGAELTLPPQERYRLFNEGVACLRTQHRLHPLEAAAILADVGNPEVRLGSPAAGSEFGGFCADTFRFLQELAANNNRAWMSGQRDRYRFAVRQPLIELCQALSERYVEPVLRREWGWDLETTPRSGRALTSICKNDYGKSVPYHTALWIVFCRREMGGKRDDAQFFVKLEAAGLTYGLRLGREARTAGRLFRRNVQEHAELLHRALSASGALSECRFGNQEDLGDAKTLSEPGELRAWAAGKTLIAARMLPLDSALLASDELVGDILLTFDRLIPAYVCALESDPQAALSRRAGGTQAGARFTESDFRRATYLGEDWLKRARSLLDLKRQLILQGVPGTGKTHVARCLANLITGGREEAIRLVQFHPAYSYEEFVEGIKVKSVETNGRHDVTYPVEDGLLCAFAAEASRRPSEPHVLIIDEINRGNLPRVFGELLYLLEYRDQAIGLPYSKRGFRLPANLYLLGTMNAADRSVALVDQALRRRFSFLEMPPDVAVLSAWLRTHPPRAGAAFAQTIVALFERLNERLRCDLGPQCQVGHSYFMVPDLDEAQLQVVWDHHVRPLLEEYFAGQPGRTAAYNLEQLLRADRREARRRHRQTADA